MMKQVNIRIPQRILALICGLFISLGAFAQITVKGHVKDDTGEPVFGATIRVVGQQGGTTTDFDGNFSIQAPQGSQIMISFMGFATQTLPARAQMNVTLHEDAKVLDDIVVIGYGVAKKTDLTGSVTALKPDMKNKGVVVNPQDMLQGKVAGVSVTSNDGTPGGGAEIRIRGGSSLNASNDPLIVIDGVAIDNNGVKGMPNLLNIVNPQDIESFNILKDASATAIYGSRGSNGVIIITTKKGMKSGSKMPQISYAGSVTVSTKKKTWDLMDGDQYRDFINNLFGAKDADGNLMRNAQGMVTDADGKVPDPIAYMGTANTDWQDLIYRTAVSHDHNVNIGGAVGNLPYRVSLGYTNQKGIIKGSDFQRYTGAINLSPSLFNDHLNLNLNAKGIYAKTIYANTEAVGAAVMMDPTQDPHAFTSPYHTALNDIDKTLQNFGGYFQWPTASSYNDSSWAWMRHNESTKNPLSLIDLEKETAKSREFIGSADIDYKIHGFEDMRLHVTLGADIAKGKQERNMSTAAPNYMYYGSQGFDEIYKRNLQLSAYAQYFKDFNENHHFDIMAGYEWAHYYRKQNNDYVAYYPQTQNDASLRGTERPHVPYEFKTDNYLVSFFGRANYSLLNRYLFTATVREDGSSRFSNHWALFPSAAFAWKIKEEPLMKNIDYLSEAKLRLGWGKTGQQDGVSDYIWIPTYSKSTGTNGFYPLIAGDNGTLYRPDNYNKELKWETTTTYNLGADIGFLDNRITASVDAYFRHTTDLINSAPSAALSAFINEGLQNIGTLNNYGVELGLSVRPVVTKNFYWVVDYNFTYNHNEITDLTGISDNGDPVMTGGNVSGTGTKVLAHQVAYPANTFYVYQQVYDQNGMPIENCVVDRNGDGSITEADKYLYKPTSPLITMGLSSRMEWKNWDFGFALRASLGNYVYNGVEANANLSRSAIWAQNAYIANRTTAVLDRNWQTDQLWAKQSDYYVQNASFLKCDNITLGYSFADLFRSSNWHGISGRLYGTVANVFTITKYSGLDPEVPSSVGIDGNVYPRPISFILGLNLNF